MRVIGYYILHTVKNQIRKLFHTWVAIVLVACFAVGLVAGIASSLIFSAVEPETEETEPPAEEAPAPDTVDDEAPPDPETVRRVLELGAGAVALVVLAFGVLTADRGIGSVFLPADTALLFPAPRRPQWVLLFRLAVKAGGSLMGTLWLAFYLPMLRLGFGLRAGTLAVLLAAWLLLLLSSKLLTVFCYLLITAHPTWKSRLRGCLVLLALAVAVGFLATGEATLRTDPLGTADRFFNAPLTRAIPVWGWLKGAVGLAAAGQYLPALGLLAAAAAAVGLLVFAVLRMPADFYEDVLSHTEEVADLQAAATEGRAPLRRRKARNERRAGDGLARGAGASVYFFQPMYTRFRFAHLHIFTNTSLVYLCVSLLLSILLLILRPAPSMTPVAAVLAGMVFLRTMGNPLTEEAERESFALLPDTAHRKVFFAFAAGFVANVMDVLPAFLLSALVLDAAPGDAVLWFLLLVSVGLFSDGARLFLQLSLPASLARTIRSVVQVLFLYFGLMPALVLLSVGLSTGHFAPFAAATVALHVAVAALSLAVSPLFILHGRK